MLFLRRKSAFLSYLLIVALILLPFGVVVQKAEASSLTNIYDVIDDSRPTNDSSHLIQFVTPTGVALNATVTITFATGFDLTGIDFNDLDLAQDDDNACNGTWTDKVLAAAPSTTSWGVSVDTGNRIITLTAPSTSNQVPASRCLQIEIGDNATGGSGNDEINNGAAGVHNVTIGGTFGDTGTAKIVVLSTITASVTVNESLTFTVTGQTASSQCQPYSNGAAGTVDTTSTSIPFGTATVETFYDGCQALNLATNSVNGYTVTVQESDQLNSGLATIADGTCDGACSETAEGAWATATNNGLAYCMQDYTGNGAATADAGWGTNGCDAASTYFKIFAEKDVDTPAMQLIMSSTTPDNDTADIGYRLSVDTLQAAGTYTNNIIFVGTPNY